MVTARTNRTRKTNRLRENCILVKPYQKKDIIVMIMMQEMMFKPYDNVILLEIESKNNIF